MHESIHSLSFPSLEERGFNAWPARRTVFVDGWLCRLNDGFTKRANSVNAWCPGADFGEVRQAAEALYRRHGLPCVFRLSPLAPAGADAALAQAGYRLFDPSRVMLRALHPLEMPAAVSVETEPDEA